MSSSTKILQDVAAVDDFFDVAATETAPLFEHLEFEFLREYDMFAPLRGANTNTQATRALQRFSVLLLQRNLRNTSSHTRTPKYADVAVL